MTIVDLLLKRKCNDALIYGQIDDAYKVAERLSGKVQLFQLDTLQSCEENNIFPKISLLEAYEKKINTIILVKQLIADRNSFYELIDYCKKNNAKIFDIRGGCISDAYFHSLQKEQAVCDKQQLIREICAHDNISFDIFDTLLLRNVLYPEDVFELMEKRLASEGVVIEDFKIKRKRAQEAFGLNNPNIHQIYEMFADISGLEEEACIKLKMLEIDIEKEVLEVRDEVLEIFKLCLKMKKKIYLITDMYIPKDILITILEEKGITGYDAIYVSCDKKKLKLQGLFEDYKKEKSEGSYLHIGDHRIHDGICAELSEIDYYLIPSAINMGQSTIFSRVIEQSRTLEENIICGMILAKMFNDPFKLLQADMIEVKTDYEYSYIFCACIICRFVLWMYNMVEEKEYDDILFASRDGYLLQKMYRSFLKKKQNEILPKGKYFYTSRKAAVMTGINNEAMVNMIIDISAGLPPEQIMTDYFGIESQQMKKFDENVYGDSIHKYVWEHANEIFERAEKAKLNYFKYMGNIELQIGRKYAFVDFVSSGTSQKALSRIAPFLMEGLYVGWNSAEDRTVYHVDAMVTDKNSYFLNHYKMLETFMTSAEPSLKCIDENGNPVFNDDIRTDEELQYMKNMQEAVSDFFDKFISLVIPERESISVKLAEDIFSMRQFAKIDEESILGHLVLIDDWNQRKNKVD